MSPAMSEWAQPLRDEGRTVDTHWPTFLLDRRPRYYIPEGLPCTPGRYHEEDTDFHIAVENGLDQSRWRVGDDYFEDVDDVLRVSTVWLGIDHSFGFGDEPLIWETMIFSEHGADHYELDTQCWRHATREEAFKMHRALCLVVPNLFRSRRRRFERLAILFPVAMAAVLGVVAHFG